MANRKKILAGRINSDDAENLVQPNEVLGALNMRSLYSGSGKFGRSVTIEGNTIRNKTLSSIGVTVDFTLPAGTNEVNGAFEDAPNRRLVWFNWNSNGDHGLYCYDLDKDRIFTVMDYTKVDLELDRDNPVHSADFAGKMFYWTNNVSKPKRINIDSGIKAYHPTYVSNEVAYGTVNSQTISLARPQPIFPLTAAYVPEPTGKALDRDMYNAAYRFVYKDGETSAFSELSARQNVGPLPGYIRFTVPYAQKIADDIDRVELAVRYEFGGQYVIFKTWDRAVDLTAITNHNAGTANLMYDFFDDSVGISVAQSDAAKPFDNVPRLAEALAIVKNRLTLINTLAGYDSPKKSSLSVATSTSVNSNQLLAYKSGSSCRTGIMFYDEDGAFCPVFGGGVVSIPERIQTPTSWVTSIDWTLSNTLAVQEIPEWAHSYSIVRTNTRKASSFVQFKSTDAKFVTKNDATGEYSLHTSIAGLKLFGSAWKASDLFKYGLGYSFAEGDWAIIYSGTTNWKVRVIDTFGDYIITDFVYLGDDLTTVSIISEVYTPAVEAENEKFYEVGNRYLVSNPGTSLRQYSTLTGQLGGDVVIKQRVVSVSDSYYAEVMNYNDRSWKNWFKGVGRVNIESNIPVLRNHSAGYFSNVYSNGSNGLSSFEALNFFLMPIEMGPIRKAIVSSKVQQEGSLLIVIGEQEHAAVYIGESQIFDVNNSSFLAKSSGFIGQVNVLKGSYGTINPESAYEWKGSVCFFDANQGAWVLVSGDGPSTISEQKMFSFWRTIGQDVLAVKKDPTDFNKVNPGPLRVLGGVDPFHKERLALAPRVTVIPQNTILRDMEISTQSYGFVTAPDCNFSVEVIDLP